MTTRTLRDLPPRPDTAGLAPDDLLTREEVAGYLRMAERTVRDWTDLGDRGTERDGATLLPAIKIGNRLKYRWRDVQTFAAAHGR